MSVNGYVGSSPINSPIYFEFYSVDSVTGQCYNLSDANYLAGKGYLGPWVDLPQTGPATSVVAGTKAWRRKATYGEVWWVPRGAGAQQITLNYDVYNLKGSIPWHDGSKIPAGTTITLPERSGRIFLYKNSTQTVDTVPPTTPSITSVTAISTSQITINWSASTDDSGILKYNVFRKSATGDSQYIGSTSSTTYTDSGLSASTSYTYTVSAVDNSSRQNESAQSISRSTTTKSAPSAGTFAPASHPFPRIGCYSIGVGDTGSLAGTSDFAVKTRARMADLQFVITPGGSFQYESRTRQDVYQEIKDASGTNGTNVVLVEYVYYDDSHTWTYPYADAALLPNDGSEPTNNSAKSYFWLQVENFKWWEYRSGASGPKVETAYAGSAWYNINPMHFSPKTSGLPLNGAVVDPNDLYPYQFAAWYTNQLYAHGPLSGWNVASSKDVATNLDGYYVDNMFPNPGAGYYPQSFDFDRAGGSGEVYYWVTIEPEWRKGQADFPNYGRTIDPSRGWGGNFYSNISRKNLPTYSGTTNVIPGAPDGNYNLEGALDIGNMEWALGVADGSPGAEGYEGTDSFLKRYKYAMDRTFRPSFDGYMAVCAGGIQRNNGKITTAPSEYSVMNSASDFQGLRYNLGIVCMGNGYFCDQFTYWAESTRRWDETHGGKLNSPGWLGQAIDGAQDSVRSIAGKDWTDKTVYARRFANGAVFLNQRGANGVKINLDDPFGDGTKYQRLECYNNGAADDTGYPRGNKDINNGLIGGDYILPGGDAIFVRKYSSSVVTPPSTTTTQTHKFPKFGRSAADGTRGGDQSYSNADDREIAAKTAKIILLGGNGHTFFSGDNTREIVYADIKTRSSNYGTNLKIVQYDNYNEVNTSNPLFQSWLDACNTNNWWLYESGADPITGTIVRSTWNSAWYLMNPAHTCPQDSGGLYPYERAAQITYDFYVNGYDGATYYPANKSTKIDGYCVDNIFTKPDRQPYDIMRDKSGAFDQWYRWRAGQTDYATKLKSLNSNLKAGGNLGGLFQGVWNHLYATPEDFWKPYSTYPFTYGIPSYADYTGFEDKFDFATWEISLGGSGIVVPNGYHDTGIETQAGWGTDRWLKVYKEASKLFKTDSWIKLQHVLSSIALGRDYTSTSDFQAVRYGLAMCSMGDYGYWTYQGAYGDSYSNSVDNTSGGLDARYDKVYDEMYGGGLNDPNWLGYNKDPHQDSPWPVNSLLSWTANQTVYARRFDGGAVFINARGASPVEINLDNPFGDGTKYQRLSSNPNTIGNTGINNGTIGGKYTLPAGDAIFVRKYSTAVDSTPTTPTTDTTAPTVPSQVGAAATGTSSIKISWVASSDLQSGVSGYFVYKLINGNYTKLNSSPVKTTYYDDSGLSQATSYSYKVSAIDIAGNESSPSSVTTATTNAPAPTSTSFYYNHPYPRKAGGWGDPDQQAHLASRKASSNCHVVMLNGGSTPFFPNNEGLTRSQAYGDIKIRSNAIGTHTKIIQYCNYNEVVTPGYTGTPQFIWSHWGNAVTNADWWLYETDTAYRIVSAWGGGNFSLINMTHYEPTSNFGGTKYVNAVRNGTIKYEGKYPYEYAAWHTWQTYEYGLEGSNQSTQDIDYYYCDNMFWYLNPGDIKNPITGIQQYGRYDIARDGTGQDPTNKFMSGESDWMTYGRTIQPNKGWGGNGLACYFPERWPTPDTVEEAITRIGPLKNQFDCGFMEYALGDADPNIANASEPNIGAANFLKKYKWQMTYAMRNPDYPCPIWCGGLSLTGTTSNYNGTGLNSTPFQAARYFQGLTAMGNGYFLDVGTHPEYQPNAIVEVDCIRDFDETVGGTLWKRDWLGYPTSDAAGAQQDTPWSGSVYRRTFTNGAVFVNARDGQTLEINLDNPFGNGVAYKRLNSLGGNRGYPTINNGQGGTYRLFPGDAIFLIKV